MSHRLKTIISKVSEFSVSRNQKALSEVIGICKEPVMINGYESYHIVRCQNKYYDKLIKDKKDKYNAKELFSAKLNMMYSSSLQSHSKSYHANKQPLQKRKLN